MPEFLASRNSRWLPKKKRGRFFPFFDRLSTQNEKVASLESLGTVTSGGVTLKFATETSSGTEAEQKASVEDIQFPTVIVEFAPHNDFNEGKYAPSGFTDVTQFVRSANGTLRKRAYEIGRFEAGSLSVVLDNHDGRFTPGTPRSPYFPDIKANRRFRLRGKNMQDPNVAMGGGRYLNTVGFFKATGTYASDYANNPTLGSHSLFFLPSGMMGTYHIETSLDKNAPVATHDLVEFYAPIELGVRLSHSAYVWLVSGTEAADSLKEFVIVYYDYQGLELTPVNPDSCRFTWDYTPTTPMRVHISDQPPAEAKYAFLRLRVTHNSVTNVYSEVVYGISGIQTEVPENNLAPLMDSVNFAIEGAGNIYEDGNDTVSIAWGADAAGATFKVPRMVPGDLYTFTATVNKQGVELIMTADEGASGVVLDQEDSTLEVSSTFIANRVMEEIKFIPLEPLPGVATNMALGKNVLSTTPICQASEAASKAVNGSWSGGLSDKYCTCTSPAFLTVDLGESRDIQGFIVRHARAGGETSLYNTRDFQILVSDDNVNFTQIVNVAGNEDDITVHPVVCRGRYAKLYVTDPTQISDPCTRIYEFEIYDTNGLMPSTTGSVVTVKNLTIRKGDTTDTEVYPPIPTGAGASEEDNGVTNWEMPKPIFDGWTEDWPADAQDHTSTTQISVNDRLARLGNVSLSHTLKEALFQDDADMILPFDDDPVDSQGMVSNLGAWADTGGMTSLPITGMGVDLTGASYAQGVAGPSTDDALQFTRQTGSPYRGYCIPVPFTAQFISKLAPPEDPPVALPVGASDMLYTKKYYASWSHTYKANGSLKSDDATNPNIFQGDCTDGDASCSSNGDLRALVGFNFGGIKADLTDKRIRYVALSLHAEQWWFFSGGYAVIGTHNYTDNGGPQTWSNSRVEIGRWRTSLFRRDSWQTISLGIEVAYEILSGATTGIAIGPALSQSLDYYGSFTGHRERYKPYLTIQYMNDE